MTHIQLLLIEDEVIIAENMRQSLIDLGYEVVQVCNSYEEALKAIEEEQFDLAIMDINLGDPQGRTGLDLATIIKEKKPSPFIFVTAYSDLDTVSKASQLGPSAYLVKPVNDKTMFSTIQIAIQNFSNNKAAERPSDKVSETTYFYTKIGSKTFRVNWEDVYIIRAVKNYVEIKTTQHSNTFLIRTSLTHCLDSLMPESVKSSFVKINRAEAIKADIVKVYDNQKVITDFGEFKLSADSFSVLEKTLKSK